MNPYYQRDLKEGRITKDQAQELLEFLWIKMDEFGLLEPPELHGLQSGGTWYQTMNLGGMTKDGDDATNDMSFLMLDATESIRTLQPTFALRYHPKINPGIVYRTIDLLRTGIGFPAIFNDSTIIPFITNRGIPLEDAREYGIYACVLWSIPGKNMRKFPNPGCLSAGKCLMLALYQGMDKFTGKQIGCMTPDVSSFSCIEDVLDAYGKQVEFVFDKMAKIDNIGRSLYRRYLQRPFTSALFDGCIEKGKDMTAWTYHAYNPTLVAGTVNVVDSLAAIKKFVFDDKILTMKELVEACENNFEGREDLRQRLINEAPKFGNDDDYVDSLAREVYIRTSKEVAKSKDLYGASWCIDGSLGGGHYSIGRGCGATPDGRKDNEAFADATLSPMAGMDKNGPTAVIKSTSKIDPLMTQTLLLNQKFLPQFLEGENKKVFADYLKTWADLGHWHVQFNVVSKGTLLDAQQRPEDYSDLIVRVAGYSAYFVDLSKGVQDDIIARTEQRF
jgi:formate C-acetyltransferase